MNFYILKIIGKVKKGTIRNQDYRENTLNIQYS